MPSLEHQAMVALFENSPELAVELLRWLALPIPPHVRVRREAATLSEVSPLGHQADVVVVLEDARARSVLGVVLEIQRGHHRSKRYTWPLYQDAMMARLGCPTELLIVPLGKGTARWVRSVLRRIEGERRPMRSVAEATVPIVTDPGEALRVPARAVFSAVWYAGQADAERAALVAFAVWRACMELERGLGELYFTMINRALTDVAAQKLEALMAASGQAKLGYFERKYLERGREEGREEGRVETLIRLLGLKFGALPEWATKRVADATTAELDAYERHLLQVSTLEEFFSD